MIFLQRPKIYFNLYIKSICNNYTVFYHWELLFPPYGILARPIFFSKNAFEVSGFHNPNWSFPLL